MLRVLKGSLAHWPRVVHTAIGVALAVALVCGTFVLTDTIDAAFAKASAPAPGEVDVVVRSSAEFGAVGNSFSEREAMPATVLAQVQAVPGVQSAWGTVWGYARLVNPDGTTMALKGLPAMGTAWTPDTVLLAGRPPTAPDEVTIDSATAKANRLRVGDRIRVLFADAVAQFRIGGLSSASRLVSSTLASFDLTTAQRVLGEEQRLDAISVRGVPGIGVAALRARIAAALPDRYEAVTPDQVARQAKESWTRSLGFLTTGLLAFAAIALLVGGFLIFNTFSVLVAHRSRELGLLRAVGAGRRQLMASVLAEAAVIGVVASVAGVGGGLFGARGLLALMRAVGLSIPTTAVVFRPRTAAIGLLVGVTVTTVAALVPAWRANSVSPLAALSGRDRDGAGRRRPVGVASAVSLVGLLAVGAGLAGLAPTALVGVGGATTLVGMSLLVPVLVAPAASVFGALVGVVSGEPALLGRENARRSPRRTAATASALMIGIGLIGVVAVLASSMKASATSTLQKAMLADYTVSTYAVPGSSDGVPPVAAERLRRSPAVAAASEIRSGQWGLGGRTQTLVAVDPATVTRVYHLDPASSAAAARLDDGGVLVRSGVAARHGWKVGDQVPMTFARTGTRPMRLEGIYSTTTVRSDYVISVGAFERNFTSQLDMEIDVRLAPGVPAAAGRSAIRSALSEFPNLAVRNQAEVLATQKGQVDRMLMPMAALLALSVVIALLGIANTLALSIHERIRELGMLRAIGMGRGQLRSMIRSEAVVIAGLGTACGLAVAVFFGWVATGAMAGMGVTRVVFPVGQLLALAAAATAAGLLAAAVPAHRASRLRVLDAVTAPR
jgi:putative ABC transport system permease protein